MKSKELSMKERSLTFGDKSCLLLATLLPTRFLWYCVFRAWAIYQARTGNRSLPSEVKVTDLVILLDDRRPKNPQ